MEELITMERPATKGRRRSPAASAQAFCIAKIIAVSDKNIRACELRADGYEEWRG